MKTVVRALLVGTLFLVTGGVAAADQRNYVWTYEYLTLAAGGTEAEFYQTMVTKDRHINGIDWQQQVELEYGITDHLDAALYQVYDQKENDTMKYSGFKLRLRYRLAERNRLPLDTLLYVEHQEKADAHNVFEGKLILAKDIGSVNISYNQIYKNTYAAGDQEEHEYAFGVSYEVSPSLRLGAESKGNYTSDKFAAGPTIAWVGGRIWANLGAVYAMNSRTNNREVRFLLGVPF